MTAARQAGIRADDVTVSVVLPTLNERAHIRDCLDSLLVQDFPGVVEILVVDGGSTDGTREVVEGEGGVVRLLDNPEVSAAAAMNVGIGAARAEVICRADAHTLYAPNYVRRCVEVLLESGAANVGGRMQAVGTTSFGRAVAAVTSSRIGVGPGRFHYLAERAEVETVYLGCWWRQTLVDVGGYDTENLQWAAEDQELNFRLRRAGGRVLIDPSIHSWYFPRDNPRALLRQYSNYGVAKASTLAKHRTLPYWRPLAPAALVAAAALSLVLPGRWRLRALALVVGPWSSVAAAESMRLSKDPGVAWHRAFGALAICHWGYGVGFWRGVVRFVSGRGFDARPRRGR